MWHSVVHTVRLWSDKPVTSGSSIRVLELHQVVSAKERSFIEVLHQLSGEEQWSNIILLFLRKMIVSLTKTRLTSVTQHGRNIRCILVCARILLQDGSDEETRRLVSAVLRYLIERDTSDKVDELCAIFNKVIMSRLKKTTPISSLTCLTKLDDAIYRGWFEEAVNAAVNTGGLDLHSFEAATSAHASGTRPSVLPPLIKYEFAKTDPAYMVDLVKIEEHAPANGIP
ncbi:unnamed protein product [Gongylonema pulchrum]|uniref:DUF4704 domain-containing protein n=1 Tax=Gongylonema pulchrum TaxID=637853 RepID=A0A183E4E4_9BILA|nr:unnamed protein product [Gongylonema pulchrum]